MLYQGKLINDLDYCGDTVECKKCGTWRRYDQAIEWIEQCGWCGDEEIDMWGKGLTYE